MGRWLDNADKQIHREAERKPACACWLSDIVVSRGQICRVCVCLSVSVCVCVYVRVRARSDAHILLANFWGKGRLNLAKSKRYASNSMLHARNPKPEEPLSPP